MSLPPTYDVSDKSNFGYDTVHRRLLTVSAEALQNLDAVAAALPDSDPRKADASLVRQSLEKLDNDVRSGKELVPLEPVHADGRKSSIHELWNSALKLAAAEIPENTKLTWHHGPWLILECLFYRELVACFQDVDSWKQYDIFSIPKQSLFAQSSYGLAALAQWADIMSHQVKAAAELPAKERVDRVKAVVHEAMQLALWGNATDLSLIRDCSEEELKKIQDAEALEKAHRVLVDDFEKIWLRLHSSQGQRVDIVLDNYGFEVCTDIVLAMVLLDSGLVSQVAIHPKSCPWMVSDVTMEDWLILQQQMADPKVFPLERESIDKLLNRLREYEEQGQIVLRYSPFWTTAEPYRFIQPNGPDAEAKRLYESFSDSALVIFKGDLNYRKLMEDRQWEPTTPFKTSLRDMGATDLPIVSLRTVKSDPVVGVAAGVVEKCDKEYQGDSNWRWVGQYAVISASLP